MRTRAVVAVLSLVVAAMSAGAAHAHQNRAPRGAMRAHSPAVRASRVAKASKHCPGYPQKVTISGTSQSEILKGTAGADVIAGGGGNDVIKGGGGNDIMCGEAGNDRLFGEGDHDSLGGGAGKDTLIGASGNDYFLGEAGADTIDGGPGTLNSVDYLFSGVGVTVNLALQKAAGPAKDKLKRIQIVYGSSFDDVVIGDAAPNGLYGVDGSDTMIGGAGDDYVDGGLGVDVVGGGPGDDTVNGAEDDDIAFFGLATGPVTVDLSAGTGSGAGEGTDVLQNSEAIFGSDFDDTLVGNSGSNFMYGGAGNDHYDGQAGLDLVTYFDTAVTADLQAGTATGAGNDTFTAIEGLGGSEFDDVLTGDGNNNYLDGAAGNDTMTGNGGDDYFTPGAGNDTVNGGAGTYDMIDYFTDASINVNLITGTSAGEGSDTLSGIEGIGTADQADTIVADDNVNYIFAWGGDDNVKGAGGNDEINGGFGADTIDGESGTDLCVADATVADLLTNCESTTGDVRVHPLFEFSNTTQRVRFH